MYEIIYAVIGISSGVASLWFVRREWLKIDDYYGHEHATLGEIFGGFIISAFIGLFFPPLPPLLCGAIYLFGVRPGLKHIERYRRTIEGK